MMELSQMSTPLIETPAVFFLEKLRATQVGSTRSSSRASLTLSAQASPAPSTPSHHLRTTMQPARLASTANPPRSLSSLPPLPDEDDEDLAKLFGGLGLAPEV